MTDDIRIYNYLEDGSLISQGQQAKKYFDEKFANIHVDVDVDISEIDESLDNITKAINNVPNAVNEKIQDAKSDIIEAIEDSKPCLCHLATKEDVCKAKCEVINKITEAKEDIDETFFDLNEQINDN